MVVEIERTLSLEVGRRVDSAVQLVGDVNREGLRKVHVHLCLSRKH